MSKYKRIFIVGHPGAGKALLAKTVAEKLGWQFINADLGLEFHIGGTVNEILGSGEDALYDCEFEILKNQIDKENIVVTTDPSIVCSQRNREILSKEFTVHLEVSIPVQLERNARNSRPPLLLNGEIGDFFDKLHRERDGLYDQVSVLKINSDDNALEDHAQKIIEAVLGEKEEAAKNQLTLSKNDMVFFHKINHAPIRLSEQQALCFKLLAQGKSSKEISRDINVSYRTVEGHIANIMELLGCSSSKELIALYYDQP